MSDNPYLFQSDGELRPTEAGLALLQSIVTNPTGGVYVFTSKADPVLVAAAMARLSRSDLDLRINYLKEFAVAGPEQAEVLFRRVITEYGDDSVKQLLTIACVVEGASNLLTKKLEWGRLAAYLEQSTRYIYFDKLVNGRYRYFTPPFSTEAVTHTYQSIMDEIFATYSEVVRGVTAYLREKNPEPSDRALRQVWMNTTRATACDAARPMLPAATTSTVGIVASAQSLEKLIWLLSSETLEECNKVGIQLLGEARTVAAPFFERTDMPERGGYMVTYARDIQEKMRALGALVPSAVWDGVMVKLLDYWPRDEYEVVAEMLFPHTSVSVEQIKEYLKDHNIREEVFRAYMGERLNRRNKPGRAMEKHHYEWEIVGDYGTFRDLQRHRMVDMWEWQRLSPYLGYSVPDLICQAGFEAQFVKCFARSEALFFALGDARYEEEAQYATLLGHRMRYRFMMNAREAFHMHELRTGLDGHPGYRKIVLEMHRMLSEVHPAIAGAMQFVNTREDPELTRMASERATQARLQLLEGK